MSCHSAAAAGVPAGELAALDQMRQLAEDQMQLLEALRLLVSKTEH
jgi:hypothetical protein